MRIPVSPMEEKGLHPRIFLNGKVGTDKLCRMIHGRSSLSVGDVKNAFEMLAQICGEELREGREVHIEGLGYFAPILRSTQKVTRSTKNKWSKMELKTIGFRSDARLRGELVGVKASRSKYARHSESLSEVEIDMRLKEYFADHDVMLRYDFQEVCCMDYGEPSPPAITGRRQIEKYRQTYAADLCGCSGLLRGVS